MKKIAHAMALILLALGLGGCAAATEDGRPAESSAQPSAVTLEAVLAGEDAAREALCLLADLPQDNIALYSLEIAAGWEVGNVPTYTGLKGMVLYQDGFGTYFPWPGLTPRSIMPQMAYRDLDSDGRAELVVSLYVGSGTGTSVSNLHVLEIKDDPASGRPVYTEHCLVGHDVRAWLTPPITAVGLSASGDLVGFALDGEPYTAANPYQDDPGIVPLGLTLGDLVGFELDEPRGIALYAALQIEHPDMLPHQYIGSVTATISWDGHGFVFSDYGFTVS